MQLFGGSGSSQATQQSSLSILKLLFKLLMK